LSGQYGDLVFTGFVNRDMPLIRYRVGDRGAINPVNDCNCGRTLPLLQGLEGRIDDVLYSAQGTRVGRLDPIFKEDLPIKRAQLIQQSLNRIQVRYVPAPGFCSQHAGEIAAQLRLRLGDVAVEFEEVAEIPRGSNGKFRAVINNLTAEQLRAIAARCVQ
jgi:phenylacetate-CoA ligase